MADPADFDYAPYEALRYEQEITPDAGGFEGQSPKSSFMLQSAPMGDMS